MSSKADDFDVRYRDMREAVRGRPGTADYDLGYDTPGWDTDGFRSVGTALRDEPGRPPQPGRPRQPGRPHRAGRPRRGRPDRSAVKVKGSWWRHWTLRKALGVLLGLVGAITVLGAIAV
ncbi:MAG: hypothetical protein JO037_18415, partial [Actinobacteria bacterium]|nr:hypothetical protein [Actinomycetota bacterium]